MADQDVIREFLVKLGFQQDERGLRRFTGGIDDATRAVTRLVATIAGASLTVAAGVSAFASNLEGLYFASQRIGASANSLRAAEYAARDLGASAAEMRGSLESVARFLRENPGGEGYLQSLGIQTRDANGNLKDTTELLAQLGQRFTSMPWYQSKQYANLLGIDDNTLRAIQSPQFAQKLAANRAAFANTGLDKATRDAHDFMVLLRDVGKEFENFSIQVQAALMEKLGPDLRNFAEWFRENGPMIAERVADIVVKLVALGEEAGPYLRKIWDMFVELDAATNGWSTKIIALLVLLRALGGAQLVGGIMSLSRSFVALSTSIAGVATAAALIKGDTSDSSRAAQEMQQVAMAGSREAAVELARTQLKNQWWRSIFGEVTEEDVQQRADEIMRGDHAGMPSGFNAAGMSGNDLATFAMDFFQSQGWSRNQAAGLAANLQAESAFNPRAVGDNGQAKGIAQWHPDRQAAFSKWAGFGLDDDRADLVKQLEFVNYELTQGAEQRAGKLLAATDNARDAGAVVSRYYERPKEADYEAKYRGRQAVQLTQTTNINVQGGGDPNSTAQAVAGAQNRVNEEMTRNLNSAVN